MLSALRCDTARSRFGEETPYTQLAVAQQARAIDEGESGSNCLTMALSRSRFGVGCVVSLSNSWNLGLLRVHPSCKLHNEAPNVKPYLNRKVKRVFSGIQPTGIPHIGNYLGAIQNWIHLQEEVDTEMILSIVDLHSITLPQDPKELRESILTSVAVLLACGINPEKSILFQQSSVHQHAELSWILGCKTTLARLGQFPQWKAKAGNDKTKSCVGLYTYPVLQSADILLYKATHVPVGEDQLPHLELAQDIARIFNNNFGEFFPTPKPIVGDFKKIKSLRNPEQKMSKSESDPKGKIELTDSHQDICEKFKKAKTDFISKVTYDPDSRPGVSNLVSILCAFTGKEPERICQKAELLNTAQFKMVVADVINEKLEPIRTKVCDLMRDKAYLEEVLKIGQHRAQEIAETNFETIKKMVGLS